MNRLLRKIRYIRHPYLILRAIKRPFEERENLKHLSKLKEYQQYSMPLETVALTLLHLTKQDMNALMEELETSGISVHIKSCVEALGWGGEEVIQWGSLLYIVVRSLRPQIVVETGVANGVSTTFILSALSHNKSGLCHSIDLHYRDGVFTPIGKSLGWIIPKNLRNRWRLSLGESTKVLPNLLLQLRKIDIFFHDSCHLYRTMMSEYSIVWRYLKKGGLLVSDDVILNDAFLDFSEQVGIRPIVLKGIGILQKSENKPQSRT